MVPATDLSQHSISPKIALRSSPPRDGQGLLQEQLQPVEALIDLDRAGEDVSGEATNGWVTIFKNFARSAPQLGRSPISRLASSSFSCDKVFLATPAEGSMEENPCDTISPKAGPSSTKGSSADPKCNEPHDLKLRVVECGKIIGLLVDNCPGGWSDMVNFATARDKQNREELETTKCKKERS